MPTATISRRDAASLLALGALTRPARALFGPVPQPMILASSKQARTLAMVDAATLTVLARFPVAEDPHEVVVGPDGRTAWVSHLGDGRMHLLSRVDLVGRRSLPPVDVSPLEGVHGIAVHGGALWLTAVGSKAIGRLDPATGRVTEVLGTGQENSHMLWVARDGRTILVANSGSGTLSLFRLDLPRVNTGAGTPYAPDPAPDWSVRLLPTGPKAEGFAVSPDEREAWVGDDEGFISVIDIAEGTVQARWPAGLVGANRLRFTPDGRRVIATTHAGPELLVFDADRRQIVAKVPIEQHGASGIAVEPNGRRAFVACPRDHFVAVVDLARQQRVATIDVGREPDGIAWWAGT